MASNSKDYYRMRHGQAGMDPTDNGEPQSIFDAGAMDYGAPKSSVVTTKRDEKGVTESEVIIGQDDSKSTSSFFRPSKIFGNWFDPENYGFKPEDNNGKLPGFFASGFPTTYSGDTQNSEVFIPAAFDGTEKSAMEAWYGEQKANAGRDVFKALLRSGNTVNTGVDGNLQNRNTDAALAAYEADMANAISKEQNIASRHPEGQPKDESFFGGINNFFEGIDESLKPSYTGFQGFDTPEVMQGRGYSSEDDTMTRPFLPGLADRERTEGYVYPATGSGELANRGEGEAEELFALENPQTWTPEVVEKLLSKSKPTLSGAADRNRDGDLSAISQFTKDQQILANNVTAQESLDLLRQELKALKSKDNYKVNSQESYLDFLRENGVLKDFRPELYKALAGAAFGMLMGQDIDDAFYNSFGAMQAEKDFKADEDLKFEREKEIENLKLTGKGGSFGKTPLYYNVGSYLNPIKVNATVLPNGLIRIIHPSKGQMDIAAGQTDANGEEILKPWYTTQEIGEQVRSNIDRITTLLKGDMNKFIEGKDIGGKDSESIVSSLLVASEVEGAVYDAIDKGINLGPGAGSNTAILTNAANAAIEHRIAFPESNKGFRDHLEDMLIKADIKGVNDIIPQSAYLLNRTYTNGDKVLKSKPIKDEAYAEVQNSVNDYIIRMKRSKIEGIEGIVTNSQKYEFAYNRFEDWSKEFPTKAKANYIVAHETGYTPFMYWAKKESKNY